MKATRCKFCDKEFTTPKRYAWYCSQDCDYAAKRGRQGKDIRLPFLDRFWGSVDVAGAEECWEWTSTRSPYGYGVVSLGGRAGRMHGAHRVAYELHHHVDLSSENHILHSCDNPPCVNPAHLRVGTHADNMEDMRIRGRTNTAKLTVAQVVEIRRLRSSGMSSKALGRLYSVSSGNIGFIVNRTTWKHAS